MSDYAVLADALRNALRLAPALAGLVLVGAACQDSEELEPQGFAPPDRVVEGMDVVDALYSRHGAEAGASVRSGQQEHFFGLDDVETPRMVDDP